MKYTVIIGGTFFKTNSWLEIWKRSKNKKGFIIFNNKKYINIQFNRE